MPEQNSRRDVILDKAGQLFATKGVAATTVREIADHVGLLSGSLYHHFESKDAIADELLRRFTDDLRVGYQQVAKENLDPRSRIERLVRVSMMVAEAHPHATVIYQNDFNLLRSQSRYNYLRTSAAESRKIWLDALTSGVESGVFRDDINLQTLYRIIRDVVWLSVRWHTSDSTQSVATYADQCAAVLLDGMAIKAAPRRRRRAS